MNKRSKTAPLLVAALLSACLVGAAGAQVEAAGQLFDVNDLSFLFPLQANGLPYPEIPVTTPNGLDPATGTTQGQIWPQHLFQQVGCFGTPRCEIEGFAEDQRGVAGRVDTAEGVSRSILLDDGDQFLKNWRVVGVRFIPCVMTRRFISEEVIPGFPAGCVPMVRLVAQPFVDNRDHDVSAHLVFALDQFRPQMSFPDFLESAMPADADSTLEKAIGFLGNIKRLSASIGADASGEPMGPHPGLVRELATQPSGAGPLASHVKLFVQAFTSPQGMTNISFMGLSGGGPEPWIFFGGDLGPSPGERGADFEESHLVFQPKGGRPAATEPAVMVSFVDRPRVQPVPAGISTAGLFGGHAASHHAAVFQVDNPELVHNFNTDCVSCHTTTTRARELKIRSKSGDQRFHTPPGITGFIARGSVPSTRWNVRNFGYFDGRPTVSTRTLTEIIDATHLLNDMVAGRETSRNSTDPVGPGLVCADERAVWNCTLHSDEDCFTDCERAPFDSVAASAAPVAEP